MKDFDAYVEKKLESYMEQLRKELIERCDKGIHEELPFVPINAIDIAAGNRCNCYCVMCPYITPDTHSTGVLNEEGHMLSVEELKKILCEKVGKVIDKEVTFSFMTGETFLNPNIYEMLKYVKNQYPNSKILVLSNGTVPPPNPEIVKYIDKLEFSIDAGTAEIYEKIRKPAKFEHMVKTVTRWVEAAKEYNRSLYFGTSTTLATYNFFDLPNIVKLVANIAKTCEMRWTEIYCQPMVPESWQEEWLHNSTLHHIGKEAGHRVLEEVEKIAKSEGVNLVIAESIYQFFEMNQEKYKKDIPYMQRFCKKLEYGTVSYDTQGEQKFACCFMDKNYFKSILKDYNIPSTGVAEDIYNSQEYWKMRKDLLEGKLNWICRDCMIGCTDYYLLREQVKKLILLEELEYLKADNANEESV